MDINALRVFDAMYALRITEDEYALLEAEQAHTERTGLYIGFVKRGNAVCVSHDENHKIVIQRMKQKASIPTPSRVLFKTLITLPDLPTEVYTLHQIAQYRARDTEISRRSKRIRRRR